MCRLGPPSLSSLSSSCFCSAATQVLALNPAQLFVYPEPEAQIKLQEEPVLGRCLAPRKIRRMDVERVLNRLRGDVTYSRLLVRGLSWDSILGVWQSEL